MEIQPPSFELRNQRCACCDGQGELVFSTCPVCGLVVLICAEIGTVYEILDRRPGQRLGDSVFAEDVCTKCGKSMFSDFRRATADEILALGLQPRDYK